MENRKHFIQGAKDSLPIILGYIPIGMTLGITASSIGWLVKDMLAMSTMVFAGSAQFIGVDMVGAGVSFATIIITTFFVNFRHFMMSSAYAPYFKNEKTWVLALLSYGITDETFAIAITKAQKENSLNAYYLGALELFSWMSWGLSTCLGLYLATFIPNYSNLGLEFALCAMFIGLIVALAKNATAIIVCLASGILSVIFLQSGVQNFNVIFASIIVCLVVAGGKRYARK